MKLKSATHIPDLATSKAHVAELLKTSTQFFFLCVNEDAKTQNGDMPTGVVASFNGRLVGMNSIMQIFLMQPPTVRADIIFELAQRLHDPQLDGAVEENTTVH